MADATGAQGGTAASAVVSDDAQKLVGGEAGAEGAQAQEPTIEIDGVAVPMSKVKNALAVEARFTQTAQEQKATAQALADKEAAIAEAQLKAQGLGVLQQVASDPARLAALREAVPELADYQPDANQVASAEMAADNLRLRFQLFGTQHPEFSEEQMSGVRAESLKLATEQRFGEALDFESIAFRLYRDDIIKAAQETAAQEALKNRETEQQRTQDASFTVPPGMPNIPTDTDIAKLSPREKMNLGHMIREAQGRVKTRR